jgi:hypothetical protein
VYAQGCFYLTGGTFQGFTNFIGRYFTNPFEVAPKTHTIALNIDITQLTYPITYKAMAVT